MRKAHRKNTMMVSEDASAKDRDDSFQKDEDSASRSKDDSKTEPSSMAEHDAKDELEVGYFYLLNCDIKATDDMLRTQYLDVSTRIIEGRRKEKTKGD